MFSFVTWWFDFFGEAFRWWFLTEILGVLSLPLLFRLLRTLGDRGYGMSKFVGIFAVTYLNWILCAVVLRNTRLSILLCIVIFAITAALLLPGTWRRIFAFVRNRWKLVLAIELIYLVGFLFFLNVRSYSPEITFNPRQSGAEKFDNFALLNSLFRSEHFPPKDAWFLDHTVNYYYFGHMEWATLGKLLGYEPGVTFNLALATLFALTLIGGFSLVYNLTRKKRWALLAAFAAAVFGNLDGLLQVVGGTRFLKFPEYFTHIDFWRSSRMIDGTITEFPYFTSILGDLHGHHNSMPMFLLGLLLGLSLYSKLRRGVPPLWQLIRRRWMDVLAMGVALGGAYATNSWDALVLAPIYLLLLIYIFIRKDPVLVRRILQALFIFIVIALSARVLFHLTFAYFKAPLVAQFVLAKIGKTEIKIPLGVLQVSNRTPIKDYFLHFGIFLFPAIIFLWARTGDFFRARPKEQKLLFAIVLFVLLFGGYGYLHYWLGGVLLILAATTVVLLLWRQLALDESFAAILLLVGFLISFLAEIYFLDDRYSGTLERYNTVFKFYNPMWHMFAVAFCVALARLFQRYARLRATVKLAAMYVVLVAAILLGLLYPIAATFQRTNQFNRFMGSYGAAQRTIDGMQYLGRLPEFADDYAVIRWIQQNVKGQPTILEATGDAYSAYSRIATDTGLITLVGWGHHEMQWRGDKIWPEILEREKAIKTIYNSLDPNEAIPLIKKYDIQYIFVGSLERKDFDAKGLEKFNSFATPVYQHGSSILYKVNR
jgi:YYY domain-containing protein